MAFSRFGMPDQGHSVINQLSFYSKKGLGMIAIKAKERWRRGDEVFFNDAESKIYDSGHLELIERIDLSGLERTSDSLETMTTM